MKKELKEKMLVNRRVYGSEAEVVFEIEAYITKDKQVCISKTIGGEEYFMFLSPKELEEIFGEYLREKSKEGL